MSTEISAINANQKHTKMSAISSILCSVCTLLCVNWSATVDYTAGILNKLVRIFGFREKYLK